MTDPILFNAVRNYTEGTKTVLDVGCGNKDYSKVSTSVVTVDAWPKVSPDVLVNLEEENLPFENNSFDCVLLLDFIEHVDKDRGVELIRQAQEITRGRVYLLTPL